VWKVRDGKLIELPGFVEFVGFIELFEFIAPIKSASLLFYEKFFPSVSELWGRRSIGCLTLLRYLIKQFTATWQLRIYPNRHPCRAIASATADPDLDKIFFLGALRASVVKKHKGRYEKRS
jgi:hypothetical protein